MNIELIGIAAGSCTTLSLVPQVLQVVKTKSTKDISLPMFLMFTTGVVLWFVYGIIAHSISVIIANVTTFILACIIIGFKIKYK